MTPSPQHPSPRPNARSAARRSWRYALLATVASAALVLSPLTLQAEADDQVPETDPTATATPTDEPTPTTSDEPSSEATSDPTSDESANAPIDEPTNQPTKEPTDTESDDPVKPGQDIGGSTDLAPLQCNTVYSIQGGSPRNLWSVNTGSGALTSVGTFTGVSGSGNLNGLGVSADGSRAFGVIANASGSGRTIYVHDRASDTTTALGAGADGAAITHGAVNPATGIYYYGGITTTNFPTTHTLNVYGFDPDTETSLGRVATGVISEAAGGNGDWAFDTQGRLYFVAGDNGDNPILLLDQTLKATAVGTPDTVTATELATSTAPAAINGLAFGGDGYLYISSSATIYQVNPSSGGTVSSATLSGGATSVDLASCAVPSTVEVVKDFPDGRAVGTDQATLSISGGGLTSAVTATTTGTDSGLQDDDPAETAGPVLGLNGNTYTVSESGTGTAAASYTSSWVCRNTTSGDRPLLGHRHQRHGRPCRPVRRPSRCSARSPTA